MVSAVTVTMRMAKPVSAAAKITTARVFSVRNGDQKSSAAGGGLLRGAGADQGAHQDAEVVAGDVDQVALVDVLAPAQPGSPHAAALQVVSERSLDDLRPLPHALLADRRAQPVAVGVDGVPRLGIAVPAKERRALRLGDPRLPDAAVEILESSPGSGSPHMGNPRSREQSTRSSQSPPWCGSEVRARSHHAVTTTASPHIRSGAWHRPRTIIPHARGHRAQVDGTRSYRRHVSALATNSHHPTRIQRHHPEGWCRGCARSASQRRSCLPGQLRLTPHCPVTDALISAPSGMTPASTYRQSATRRRRASATTAMRRTRPLVWPTRSRNQLLSALPGWWRNHSQASSTIVVRRRGLPALEIPCSRSRRPLFHGIGAKPA